MKSKLAALSALNNVVSAATRVCTAALIWLGALDASDWIAASSVFSNFSRSAGESEVKALLSLSDWACSAAASRQNVELALPLTLAVEDVDAFAVAVPLSPDAAAAAELASDEMAPAAFDANAAPARPDEELLPHALSSSAAALRAAAALSARTPQTARSDDVFFDVLNTGYPFVPLDHSAVP